MVFLPTTRLTQRISCNATDPTPQLSTFDRISFAQMVWITFVLCKSINAFRINVLLMMMYPNGFHPYFGHQHKTDPP